MWIQGINITGLKKDDEKPSALIYLCENDKVRDKAYSIVVNEIFKCIQYKYQYDRAIVAIITLISPNDVQEYQTESDEIFKKSGKTIG